MTAPVSLWHHPNARPDWETPPALFAELDAEFRFTLDACARLDNAKVPRFYSPEDDGLAQSWAGERVWMNPPYGRVIGAWMRKAWEESQGGALVVCLVPSRTCSAWWHDYAMRGEVRFIRRRVRFVGAKHTAPFPCAIVVFLPKTLPNAPQGPTGSDADSDPVVL